MRRRCTAARPVTNHIYMFNFIEPGRERHFGAVLDYHVARCLPRSVRVQAKSRIHDNGRRGDKSGIHNLES